MHQVIAIAGNLTNVTVLLKQIYVLLKKFVFSKSKQGT